MNKKTILDNVYRDSFNNELEKQSASIKYIAKKMWNPFGDTKKMSRGLVSKIRGGRKSIKSGVRESEQGFLSSIEKAKNIESYKKLQADKIKNLSRKGKFEKTVGGKLGTKSRRNKKLLEAQRNYAKADKNLTRAQAGGLVHGGTNLYRSVVAPSKLRKLNEEFSRGASSIRKRRLGNIAVRTSVGGAGVYGLGKTYNSYTKY